MNPDPWFVEILARTVFGEARDQPPEGRLAVAYVALNRATDPHRRWSRALPLVCLQPWQFSCWWQPGANRDVVLATPTDDPVLDACREIAEAAVSGRAVDNVGGANHYLRADLAATRPPSWYDPAKVTARIGGHVFLRLEPA
jgi:N-acetylmuramoyl-L-alanine amidase